jgi:hypothetical protein
MKTFRNLSVLALTVCMAPSLAMAGVHLVVSGGATPDPNNPGGWKTAPMNNGDVLTIDWTVHTKFFVTHWAGVRFRSHVLDPSEVDLLGVTMYPGLLPQSTLPGPFPGTTGIQATWWHPAATMSGITMQPSSVINFGRWTIQARNTTPANNSDVDMSAWASSIIHLGSQVSQVITLFPSWYIWATSSFEPTPGEPFPENPPHPDQGIGHWVHLGFTVQYHATPLHGSGFYSMPIGGATLGIEHVPAPGVWMMMLVSGGVLLGRRRGGRRRPA